MIVSCKVCGKTTPVEPEAEASHLQRRCPPLVLMRMRNFTILRPRLRSRPLPYQRLGLVIVCPTLLTLWKDMDFQHRAGGKTGGGGVAGWSESNRDRKERLRKLALETIDLAKVT